MLCGLEPVKYCNAAPHASTGTTRRSTWRPAAVRIDVFVGPAAMTSATGGRLANAAINGPESADAARMSTSPMLSRIRRNDAAYAELKQPGAGDRAATKACEPVFSAVV